MAVEDFHCCNSRAFSLERVGKAFANALSLRGPHALMVEIMGILALVVKLVVGRQAA